MADYGIKISEDGYDVTDDDEHMILTSKFPFLKAFTQGTASLSITSATTFTTTVTHSLGYAPAYFFFGEVNPATPNERYPGHIVAQGIGLVAALSHISTTTLTLGWRDTSAGFFAAFPYTVYFYYYIFYDQLS